MLILEIIAIETCCQHYNSRHLFFYDSIEDLKRDLVLKEQIPQQIAGETGHGMHCNFHIIDPENRREINIELIESEIRCAESLAKQIDSYREVLLDLSIHQKMIRKSSQKFLQLYPLVKTDCVYSDFPQANVTVISDYTKEELWAQEIDATIRDQQYKNYDF